MPRKAGAGALLAAALLLPSCGGEGAATASSSGTVVPACENGVQDGAETGVDCGGACGACPTCEALGTCPPTCTDHAKNGAESDEDCGGPVCPVCAVGSACGSGDDCASRSCGEGECLAPACADGVKNGDETDEDCGASCDPCAAGAACGGASDCASAVCTGSVCTSPACDDGVHNGLESDLDCGGACAPCPTGAACGAATDCESSVCQASICAAPACDDGVANGGESDVDCGAVCASPCVDGAGCEGSIDCASGVCTAEVCAVPACDDGVLNGPETSVDCGASCPACADGAVCAIDTDCASALCSGLVCVPSAVLTLSLAGAGSGVVTANPTMLSCPPDCSVRVAAGTEISTAATSSSTSIFVGWSGACSGTGPCNLDMAADTSVTANFWGGVVQLVQTFGGPGTDGARALAVDDAGYLIAAGSHTGLANFGGANLPVQGDRHAFIAKYFPDAAGSHAWSVTLGGALGSVRALGVATDYNKDIFVVGTLSGTVDLGAGPLTSSGGNDGFIVKLSSLTGAPIWARVLGGPGEDAIHGVAADNAGNPIVAGALGSDAIDLGGGPLASAGGLDIVVAKLAATGGAHLWSRTFGSAGDDAAYAIGFDTSDRVAIAGQTGGPVDFGGGPVAHAGLEDAFVAELSGAGAHLWSQSHGGVGTDLARGLAVEPGTGKVAVGGAFQQGGVSFGGAVLPFGGATDGFIAVHDGANGGAHVWSTSLVGQGDESAWALSFAANGDVLATGESSSAAPDLGGGPIIVYGAADAVVARYSALGAHVFSYAYGGAFDDHGHGIAAHPNGSTYLAGDIVGFWTYGPGPEDHVHDTGGGQEMFLLRLGP